MWGLLPSITMTSDKHYDRTWNSLGKSCWILSPAPPTQPSALYSIQIFLFHCWHNLLLLERTTLTPLMIMWLIWHHDSIMIEPSASSNRDNSVVRQERMYMCVCLWLVGLVGVYACVWEHFIDFISCCSACFKLDIWSLFRSFSLSSEHMVEINKLVCVCVRLRLLEFDVCDLPLVHALAWLCVCTPVFLHVKIHTHTLLSEAWAAPQRKKPF